MRVWTGVWRKLHKICSSSSFYFTLWRARFSNRCSPFSKGTWSGIENHVAREVSSTHTHARHNRIFVVAMERGRKVPLIAGSPMQIPVLASKSIIQMPQQGQNLETSTASVFLPTVCQPAFVNNSAAWASARSARKASNDVTRAGGGYDYRELIIETFRHARC